MGLLELKFRRILDRQDTFGIVDKGRKRVECGGFTRTGTTRDDDVQSRRNGGLKVDGHLFGKGPKVHQVINAQLVLFELTNGNERTINRDRWDHRVETRAILQTGVNIGVGFINTTTHRRDDLVDDPH